MRSRRVSTIGKAASCSKWVNNIKGSEAELVSGGPTCVIVVWEYFS